MLPPSCACYCKKEHDVYRKAQACPARSTCHMAPAMLACAFHTVIKGKGPWRGNRMRNYTAVVEKCTDTGLYVGYVPGFPGAHSQGKTMDELAANLREVIAMLLEEGEPKLEAEFVGTQNVVVA
jgi:predicted RNase H-like HicB family nuclease